MACRPAPEPRTNRADRPRCGHRRPPTPPARRRPPPRRRPPGRPPSAPAGGSAHPRAERPRDRRPSWRAARRRLELPSRSRRQGRSPAGGEGSREPAPRLSEDRRVSVLGGRTTSWSGMLVRITTSGPATAGSARRMRVAGRRPVTAPPAARVPARRHGSAAPAARGRSRETRPSTPPRTLCSTDSVPTSTGQSGRAPAARSRRPLRSVEPEQGGQLLPGVGTPGRKIRRRPEPHAWQSAGRAARNVGRRARRRSPFGGRVGWTRAAPQLGAAGDRSGTARTRAAGPCRRG